MIFTNHAKARMQERRITQAQVYGTLTHPDRSRYSKEQSSFIYNKTYGSQMIEVVASKNPQQQWVVVSVWSRPLSRLQYTSHRYYRRVGIIDWFLDQIEAFFTRRQR